MSFPRRRLIWVLPPLALVMVLLLGLAADSWLESSGGRQMLQRELSKSLGLPVRLEGDYALKLFPRLQIAGSGLAIGRPGNHEMLAFSNKYSAVIELAPFFHREVRITSIGLHGGFVDFRNLPHEALAENQAVGQELALPEVALLEIRDFNVRLEQEGSSVLVRQLQLTGFKPGHAALLDIDAGLLNGQTETARLNLRGNLEVAAGNWSSQLSIGEMELNWGGIAVAGLSGNWQWNQTTARLSGRLDWDEAPNAAELQLELASSPSPAGSLDIHYRRLDLPDPLIMGIDFAVQADRVGIQRLDVEIAAQSLHGDGCFLLTDPIGLRLSLQAEALDLDRIYSILPAQQGGNVEPPFELAIRLHAKKAWFAGAEGSDVDVAVGPAPECGTATGPGP